MTLPTPPLRVAYVLLHPPTYSETFITSEIESVRAAGATVEVFHARTGPEGRREQVLRSARTLLRHPWRVLRHLRILGLSYAPRALLASAYALRLSKQVRRFRPDVVHTHFVNLPTAVAVLIGQELGVPATALAHAADFLLERNPRSLDRRLTYLSHLFLISHAAAHQLTELGVRLGRIPHSVVRASFDGSLTTAGWARGGVPRLITIARLIDKKGIDTAIAAVARLVERDHKVQYDVYGDGPNTDALSRQIVVDRVADAVRLHGKAPHAEVMTALAEADVAVLACRRGADGDIDGIPVFLMEAASRGVPVVTTSVSGIPELVGDDGGWIVPADDDAALADALEDVLRRPDEARVRTQALQRRVRTEFSPGLQAQRLIVTWGQL